jgi:ribosomal protein L11 methylase PrmA
MNPLKPLKLVLTLLLLVAFSFAQEGRETPTGTKLVPNENEVAKLGRLKAEAAAFSAQLQSIEAQEQALKLAKQLTQEHGQAKYSEYLGYAETIKQSHAANKDWASADQVTFDPAKGTEGIFTLNPKKEEPKKNGEQKDAKEKDEKGKEIKK